MTKLELINLALMKCGLPLAATLNEVDWNAQMAFEPVSRQCMRSFAWGFATRFEKLALARLQPVHGFAHAYLLPERCLRIIDIRQQEDLRAPRARYVVAGKVLHCNVSPCNARYIYDEQDCENWPDDFADAVAGHIAAQIANLSTQTMSMTPGLLQMAQLALAQAQAVDATETTERVPLDESILLARGGRE